MKPGAILVAIMSCGLVLASTAQIATVNASTPISGIIYSNTTWTKNNSPYNLTGNVLVNYGITLTIEPGVTINLNNYYVMVNSTLQARGNSANPITFSGGQITFTQYSTNWTESTGTGCIIQNAVLSSGIRVEGGVINISNNTITGAVSVDGGVPNISNNTILGQGISLELHSKNSTISSNVISGCSIGIATLLDNNSSSTIKGNLIVNNTIGISLGAWFPEAGYPIVQNNTITTNQIGISISALGDTFSPTLLNNNIWNNTNYSLIINNHPLTVNATYNWWGTTNTTSISQSIYDFYDDFNLGKVNFTPFLDKENPSTLPVVPEAFSPIIISLFMVATLLASGIYFKKHKERK